VYLIAGIITRSILTPGIASKNDARHGIDLCQYCDEYDANAWHRFFDAMFGVKNPAKYFPAIN